MSRLYYLQDDDSGALCCCEYVNSNEERAHILACCCNCEVVDNCCERMLTNQKMLPNMCSDIYQNVQDRCRIPWKRGARLIPLDVIFPLLLLPMFAVIATLNVWFMWSVFIAIPFVLFGLAKLFAACSPKNKFFYFWALTSCALLMCVFETLVVPRLEILPRENITFLVLIAVSWLLLYTVRTAVFKSRGSRVEELSSRFCGVCQIKQPLHTAHCSLCDHCVPEAEYHCAWLDCCIGRPNLKKLMIGLMFASLTFLYGSYLTLTTVCRPYLVLELVLVPDDCSDVFFDTSMAICYVSGVYSLLLAAILFILLLWHCWLATWGLTYQNWKQLHPNLNFCQTKALVICREHLPV